LSARAADNRSIFRTGGRSLVEGRIGEINILGIHLFFAKTQALAKALEMDDFPLTQETDDVVHVRIIAEPKNVVIGFSGLLLCCMIECTTLSEPPMDRDWDIPGSRDPFFHQNMVNQKIHHFSV